MNAGKSTALLQASFNYVEMGLQVAVFTATVDDRYGVGKVTSRLGVSRVADVFNDKTDFIAIGARCEGIACLLIDEAQFLTPDQVKQLHRLAHSPRNLPSICFGIRSDFRGDAFPGSAMLLTLADSLEELKTICTCGSKASMNMRLDSAGFRTTEGEQVQIGGNESYRAACPRCFYGAE